MTAKRGVSERKREAAAAIRAALRHAEDILTRATEIEGACSTASYALTHALLGVAHAEAMLDKAGL